MWQRVAFEVNNVSIPPQEWPFCVINPDSDVRVYPIPGEAVSGSVIAAWVAAAVAAASAIYAIVMMSQMDKGGIPPVMVRPLISIRQRPIKQN